MDNTCILSGDMKIFVHHIYELQKGIRNMVLCSWKERTKHLLCNVWKNWESLITYIRLTLNDLTCFSEKKNVSVSFG